MTAPSIEHPVFLVGSERSGSTMLRLMLQHHPRIAFGSEFEFIVDHVSETEEAGWPDPSRFRDYLENHRSFRNYNLELDPTLPYPELVRSLLTQIRDRKGGELKVFGATIHYSFQKLPRLWPAARYIHLLRDPRDVARSMIGMGWAGNVWTGSKTWLTAEQEWDSLRSTLSADQFIETHFEQLVSEPAEELTRICEFLGITFDPAMLTYPEHSTYDAPDPRLSFQWKRKLGEREVQLVESRVGELLTLRGYDPSGLPKIEVDEAMQQSLLRQDYWYRVKHRVAFMGPTLFTADYLARRFAPAPIRRMVQRRVDALVNANLK